MPGISQSDLVNGYDTYGNIKAIISLVLAICFTIGVWHHILYRTNSSDIYIQSIYDGCVTNNFQGSCMHLFGPNPIYIKNDHGNWIIIQEVK